jgi:hypothetical protein
MTRRDFMMHCTPLLSRVVEFNARSSLSCLHSRPPLYTYHILRATKADLDCEVNHYTCVRTQGPRTPRLYKFGLRDEIK